MALATPDARQGRPSVRVKPRAAVAAPGAEPAAKAQLAVAEAKILSTEIAL